MSTLKRVDSAKRLRYHAGNGRGWPREGESVVMEYCNGCAGPPQPWTFDRWSEETECGKYLYRKVGHWEFTPASDPAASEIAFAHQSPTSAGRTIYELRQEISRLRAQLERNES